MSKMNKRKFIALIIVAIVGVISYFFQNNESGTEDRHLSEEKMSVHFIDVGQGDCSLIELPDGKAMLVDAGETEEGQNITRYLKSCGVGKIDFLVGTHPHSDHIGGLEEVINNFEVSNIYMPRKSHNSVTFKNLLNCIKENGLTVKSPMAGEILYENNGVKIKVLSPMESHYDDLNNYSIVLEIIYGNKSFLLTGDAENQILNKIAISGKADVLKVSHHGSYSANGERFYNRIMPEYAVISVGNSNRYGHPHRKTISILKERNIKFFRTDNDGTIVFETDGNEINVMESGE